MRLSEYGCRYQQDYESGARRQAGLFPEDLLADFIAHFTSSTRVCTDIAG